MGIIKLEIDIPDFEKELKISVTINKDGEVFYNTSSPINNVEKKCETLGKIDLNNLGDKTIEGLSIIESKLTDNPEPKKPRKKKLGGNLMGEDF